MGSTRILVPITRPRSGTPPSEVSRSIWLLSRDGYMDILVTGRKDFIPGFRDLHWEVISRNPHPAIGDTSHPAMPLPHENHT